MYSIEQRIKILKYAVRLWKDIYENNLDSKYVSQYYNYEHSIKATEFICNYGSCKDCDMYTSDKDCCSIFNFENVSNKKETAGKIYKKYKTLLNKNITKEYVTMTIEEKIKILKYGEKLWKDVYKNNLHNQNTSQYYNANNSIKAFKDICDSYSGCKECDLNSIDEGVCVIFDFEYTSNKKIIAEKIYKKYKKLKKIFKIKESKMNPTEEKIKILKYEKKLWKDVYENDLFDKTKSQYFDEEKSIEAFRTVCNSYNGCRKCCMFDGNECRLANYELKYNKKKESKKIYKLYKKLIKELKKEMIQDTEYLGCGSNSCIVEKPRVGTNSGCTCFEELPTKERLKIEKIIHRLKSKLNAAERKTVDTLKSL